MSQADMYDLGNLDIRERIISVLLETYIKGRERCTIVHIQYSNKALSTATGQTKLITGNHAVQVKVALKFLLF